MEQKKSSHLGELLDMLNSNILLLEDYLRRRFVRAGATLYLEEPQETDEYEPLELGWVRLRDFIGFGVRGGALKSKNWIALVSASPDVRVLAVEKMEEFIKVLEQENDRESAEVMEATGKLVGLIEREAKKVSKVP